MKYPSFVRDMDSPEHRSRLRMGVRSGYALAIVFALLAFAGDVTGTVPHPEGLYAMVLFKLFTNTVAWWALRADVLALELGGANVLADVIAITGAVYLTGGPLSPLFALYVLEISVIALLTNLGVTIVVACVAWFLHSTMTVLAYLAVIPTYPPPAAAMSHLSALQVALALVYAMLVIAVPTFFMSSVLRLLRRKERELKKTNEELIDAARQKSWFMANVTHELRSPIHGICGMSDLVETGIYGPVTAQQQQAHRTIKQSAKGLLALIDDLLALTRAEAGRLDLKLSPFEVSEVIDVVLASVEAVVGTKVLFLEGSVEPDLPRLVSDRGKLTHVLMNLLGNAVKFTPEQGRVALHARHANGGVEFEVQDSGIGIPEEELPRVFEPFRQVDGSDERQYGGVGLGLSLVQRLVWLLGGTIGVESEEGKGTTFRVVIPAVAPGGGSVRQRGDAGLLG